MYSATRLILLGITYAYSDEVICASFLKFLLERPVQVQISDYRVSELDEKWLGKGHGFLRRGEWKEIINDVGQRTQTNKEIICKHVLLQKSVNTRADFFFYYIVLEVLN